MRLLLRPPPLPDEWIGSWLQRLAIANRLPLIRLLTLLDLPHTLQPDQTSLERLAKVSVTPMEDLVSMVLTPDQALTSVGVAHNVRPFLGLRFLQACPLCLKDDQQPYVRKAWLTRTAVACSVHGGPLIDRCPHCRRPVQLFRLRPPARRSGVLRVSRWTPFSQDSCFSCRKPLTTSPSKMTPLPPDPILPTQFEGRLVAPSNWQSFTEALSLMIHAFGVVDLVHVDGDQLTRIQRPNSDWYNPLLPVPWSAMGPVERRFQAERILRLALTTQQGEDLRAALSRLSWSIRGSFPANAMASSPRWRYLDWLTQRLVHTPPEDLLYRWPTLASFLSATVVGKDPLRAKSTLEEYRLTDEQWLLIDEDLAVNRAQDDVGPPEARRNALEGYMYKLITRIGWSQLPVTYAANRREREYLEFWIMGWKQHRRLRQPLERLYRHLMQNHSDLLAIQTSSEVWHRQTARFFLADEVIHLLLDLESPLADEILGLFQEALTERVQLGRSI